MNRGPALKWFWLLLTAILAAQLFFVRELLAALVLFAATFAVLALLGLALFLAQRAGERGMVWVESRVRAATEFMRRGSELAPELSKRPSHRPRSEPER